MSNDPSHYIIICHPAQLTTGNDILLKLRASDCPTGGLHHETARTICGIVTGNEWNGYFSETAGGEPLGLEPDAIMASGRSYFFHVPHPVEVDGVDTSLPYSYPVCPSFQHWMFPHGNLPPSWSQTPDSSSVVAAITFPLPGAPSAISSTVSQRDGSCRMSNHRDSTQCAHLCPREEVDWFASNQMGQYNLSSFLPREYITDDSSNALTLRADLHLAFDRRAFIFVPKPVTARDSGSSSRFVAHMLDQTGEIGPLYHNANLFPISGVRPEFILARVAWAIFPLLIPYLTRGPERLLLLVKDGSVVSESVSGDGCWALAGYAGKKSRTPSPRKRKAQSDGSCQEDSSADSPFSHKRTRIPSPSPSTSPESTPNTPADTCCEQSTGICSSTGFSRGRSRTRTPQPPHRMAIRAGFTQYKCPTTQSPESSSMAIEDSVKEYGSRREE